MAKVDRLGWTAGFSFLSYGVRVGVRTNDPGVLDRVREHLPPGWKMATSPVVERIYSLLVGGSRPGSRVRRFNLLYGNDARIARSLDLDQVFELFESDLQLYVAESTKRKVFVHAGVVGWRGRAILIPGRTFSGKTTLVAEMVKAGATYYSDEYAVLDARGQVHPYSKPLSIRMGDSLRQRKHPVEELGGKAGARPLPVGMVLLSSYRKGARWRPRRLTAGQAALALLNNTVSIRRQPEAALATLHTVVSKATVFKGVRGEAHEIVDMILNGSQV